jgi:integrase/recombinase XerD
MGRDQVLFEFYLQTGCRLSEVRNLNVGDVKNKTMIRIIGKGGKQREVFLSENLQGMIADPIGKRKDKDPLFKSQKGNRLCSGQIGYSFKPYCGKAGIPPLSVHSLRHPFGTILYSKTKDLRLTQELLGHSFPQMTMKYSHINQASKQEVITALWG